MYNLSNSLSPNMAIIVAVVFMFASVTLAFLSMRRSLAKHGKMNARLSGNKSANQLGGAATAGAGLLNNFASQITLPDSAEITRIRYLLSQAGFFSPNAVRVFYAIRMLVIIVPQIILMACWGYFAKDWAVQHLVILSGLFAVLGLFGPTLVVTRLKARRTQLCREGFPDMMDLLLACIEAGLGLDAALLRVANELGRRYPPLKVALDLMNLELRAGRSRHESMVNFANRIDLEEAKALAVMLRQSEEMGSSLGAALRTFSEEMRAKRMLIAEEKAMALSAKLTVPLILFIFPTLMVILLLPAGIRMAGSF